MKHSYAIGLIFAMSLMSVVPRNAFAATPTVILSEIAWAGSAASTADEWIELANIGETPILVGGWQLTGVGTGGAAITLPEGTLLNPASTYLISNYAHGDEKTTLNIKTSFVTTAVSILNASLTVSLFDNTGLIVDNYTDTGTPDAGSSETFASMERITSTLDWANAETSTNLLNEQLGSPGIIGHAIAAPIEISESENPTRVEEPVIIEETVPETEITVPAVMVPEVIETQSTDPAVEVVEEPAPTESVSTETVLEVPEEPEGTVDAPVTPDVTDPVVILDAVPTSIGVVGEEVSTEQTPVEEAVPVVTEAPPPAVVESTSLTVTEVTEPEPAAQCSTLLAGDIVISSIYPSPNTGEDEWVALTNTTNEVIDLAGCTLVDGSGALTALADILNANATIYVLNPHGNLNNSGDTVTILDAGGNMISSVEYGTEAFPAPKKGAVLLFTSIALDSETTDSSTTQSYEEQNNTTTTSTPTTSATHTNLSTPSSDTGGTQSAAVATTSTSIPAIHTTPNIATRVATTSTPKKSTSRSTSSKSTPSTPRAVSPEEILTLADDTNVTVEGIVVALPGSVGKRSFFIDGLEIYQSQGDLAVLSIGDRVRITGTVSVLTEYQRVNIQAGGVTVLGSATPIVHEYAESLPYGSLVHVTGTVSARDGNAIVLRIDDERSITITPATGISVRWDDLAGKTLTITGILKNARDPQSIVLRDGADIVVVQESSDAAVAATSSSSLLPWLGALGTLALALAGFGIWAWRNRPQSSLTKLTLHTKTL